MDEDEIITPLNYHTYRVYGPPQDQPLRIGMLGCGVVGCGVLELLRYFPDHVQLVAVCVMNPRKIRDVPIPSGCWVTTSALSVGDCDDIDCLVDVMGGTTDAWGAIRRALSKGKHVVSANKACIAVYLADIERMIVENGFRQTVFFEAAVAGGIPIIDIMHRGLAADRIKKFVGILNATSNYILTQMEETDETIEDSLAKAQEKGYAEQDSLADIRGWDTKNKLCILVKMAFGITMEEELVYTQGITNITPTDFRCAKLLGCTIRLCAFAKMDDDGRTFNCFVMPIIVPSSSQIASVKGSGNLVEIESVNLGITHYCGVGAGRFPTANSVFSDLIELLRLRRAGVTSYPNHLHRPYGITVEPPVILSQPTGSFYVRLDVMNEPGIIATVTEILIDVDVSIFSIQELPIVDERTGLAKGMPPDMSLATYFIITSTTTLNNMSRARDALIAQRTGNCSFLRQDPTVCLYYLT